ncbi:MAG: ankyrin repeat domain-containing protein [Myxococcales bacterium]|nr:ankyrin repeat domain-containing protein [Myxococcales bacterium]
MTEVERAWLAVFASTGQRRDVSQARALATPSVIDTQDEWGMTAIHLAVASSWHEAISFLIDERADLALRYHRTGDTPLHTAVVNRSERIVRSLLRGEANPDAANYSGLTPRGAADQFGLGHLFAPLPQRMVSWPPWRVQNAEHLADYYPQFTIPSREEREALVTGQVIEVHVHGIKQPRVRARIISRKVLDGVRYVARVDPDQDTNLPPGANDLEIGPENIAALVSRLPTR